MVIEFVKKYAKIIGTVLGVFSWIVWSDFLLLVTSTGFHWWSPSWGATAGRAMLVFLIVSCTASCLFYAFAIWFAMRRYKQRGYDVKVVERLVAYAQAVALLVLCGVWGLLALKGQPAAVLLMVMAVAWAAGFLGLVAVTFYDLRRQRRHRLPPLRERHSSP